LKNVKVHFDVLEGISLASRYQFERKGFYCIDKDSDFANKKLVFNLTVGLVDRLKK
jgi:glutaminyl-tRNA synthetase